MARIAKILGWQYGLVDRAEEHFKIRYGAAHLDIDEWISAALVGAPAKGTVNVEILVPEEHGERAEIVRMVVAEVEFFLIEKKESNPWGYAQHHASTCSNVYGAVHWSFFPRGSWKG